MSPWISQVLQAHQRDWTIGVIVLILAVTVSAYARRILVGLLGRFRRAHDTNGHSQTLQIVKRISRPAQALIVLTGVGIILPLLDVPQHYLEILQKGLAVVWFLAARE